VAVGGVAYEGTGQFKFALVSPDGAQTYWSNDGTGGGGAEPSKGLPLTVSGGHYEVVLGDTARPNMLPVPATVFTHTDVHLRVWFSDGHTAFQTVDPDVPITAVGYAMVAATVPDGAITGAKLADGAVTGSHISPGAIGAAQLAPNAALQSLQGSGALVLSDQPNPTNLLEAGFSRLGTIQAESDQWANFTTLSPAPRTNAIGAWASSKLLIWGGAGARGWLVDGARYDPTTETWTPMAPLKPTVQAGGFEGLWTGSEWLLFGGSSQSHRAYNPATDTWRTISSSNAPTYSANLRPVLAWCGGEAVVWNPTTGGCRYNPVQDTWRTMSRTNFLGSAGSYAAVWTGTELFIWGTPQGGGAVGGRYDPATDQWRRVSTTKAPSARSYHSTVYSGAEVIVWGGRSSLSDISTPFANGGIYNLASDTWRSMNTNWVAGRSEHAAVWTGTEMLVWGGKGVDMTNGIPRPAFRSGGARYNPRTDTWQPIATRGMPEARMGAVTVWGNGEFRVWGGASLAPTTTYRLVPSLANDGWSYRPDTDAWRPIAGEPSGRTGHSVVWTGREFILWGGIGPQRVTDSATSGFLNSGARYSPAARRWYPISPLNAPSARRYHRAVWTGREMIVWGGEGLLSDGLRVNTLNTGGAYDPVTDTWRALDDAGAPAARSAHSMVWTGSEMLVFGGRTNFFVDTTGRYAMNTGGRYQPQTDSWASLSLKNAPSPRQSQGAVWTGTEMVIWGGVGRLTNSSYGALSDGARYNPILNLWTPVSARSDLRGPSVLVWADDAVLVWSPSTGALGRYDPILDRWNTLASGGPRSASAERSGAWTGKEMLAWSATDGFTGARYSPTSNAWTPMTLIGGPRTLFNSQGAWTGDKLMLVGGIGASTLTNGTYSYSLTKPLYLYRHP
jgi:N-acetylneuraminic acid mutarotase